MISSMQDLHVYARAVCRGGLLGPAMQRAMLAGEPLAGANVLYGEGVISSSTGPRMSLTRAAAALPRLAAPSGIASFSRFSSTITDPTRHDSR